MKCLGEGLISQGSAMDGTVWKCLGMALTGEAEHYIAAAMNCLEWPRRCIGLIRDEKEQSSNDMPRLGMEIHSPAKEEPGWVARRCERQRIRNEERRHSFVLTRTGTGKRSQGKAWHRDAAALLRLGRAS